MIFKSKYFSSVIIALLLFIGFSFKILKPQEYTSYSLIDDGQTVLNTNYLKDCVSGKGCGNFLNKVFFEKEYKRFRPTYWFLQSANEVVANSDPEVLHSLRVYIYGGLSVALLVIILIKLNIVPVFIPFGVALFIINPSFTENIVRLGPIEPYLVIFTSIYYLLFKLDLSFRHNLWLIFTSLLLITLKETSFVVIISAAVVNILFSKHWKFRRTIFLIIAPLCLYALGRLATSGNNIYTNSYILSPEIINRNFQLYLSIYLNYFGPFIKLSVLLLPLILVKRFRKILQIQDLMFWLLTALLTAGILLPWDYVLDRYTLPVNFSLIIALLSFISCVYKYVRDNYLLSKYKKWTVFVLQILTLFILLNMYLRVFPITLAKSVNYRNWYSTFLKFEHDQLQALVDLPENSVVYVNAIDELGNWEVFFELPIHMKYIYKKEIYFRRLDPSVLKVGDLIFSRSILNPILDLDTSNIKQKRIAGKVYTINQIDPIMFKNMFSENTLNAIRNYPLGDTYNLKWNINIVQ